MAENTDNSNRPKPIGHEELSNKWVGAGHLKAGDRLKKADGTLGTVVYVNTLAETRKMYNLEVQSAHTFYVGQNGWLTHNCNNLFSKYNSDLNKSFPTPQKGISGVSPFKEVPFGIKNSDGSTIYVTEHTIKNMRKRGWDIDRLLDTINNPKSIDKTIDRRNSMAGAKMSGEATIYYANDGSAVVLNNITKEIIQVTKPGYKF